MDREIELKFLIAPEAAEEILTLLIGEGAVRQLDATYFDTEGHALRKAGFGLRVRDGEGGRKQTLKSASAGGIFARGEWETAVAGPGPDGAALADTPAAEVVNGEVLRPVFTTRVERTVRMIRRGETVIEAVVDRGELIGEQRRAPVCELELELKSGPASALFDLARNLARHAALRLSLVSKAERGYALVMTAESVGTPRRANARLQPGTDRGPGPAGHRPLCSFPPLRQRRGLARTARPRGRASVARRRASPRGVMLKIFKPLAGDDAAEGLVRDLKWLAGELDAARDLDVFVAEVWRPATERDPAPDLAAFGRALLAAQTAAYLRMEAALESPRQRGLLLELAAWLEAGAWTTDPALAACRDAPAAAFAATSLGHLRHVVVKRGAALDSLDRETRHKLRLKGKTLRYAAEDLSGLFPEHPKRVERLIAASKAFQDALGRLNDQAARAELAREVAMTNGEAQAAFAAGRLTAESDDDTGMAEALAARDALANTKAFW